MSDRKFIRYQPDPQSVALIDLKANGREFKPTITAIILNESYYGCAIVFANNEIIKKGAKVKIKIGQLEIMKAEVAWVKTLEENIQKVGILLLE
ncbi:MAG: hypothetical protein B7Y39_01025 [Bdellovibrio sp. 28-41-41]|nr:MAG: hypothetical protein B7Y39_01025 [Bdellovibrio sp. 28-41-41]